MVIPKPPHCVADVVSFNNKAACFAGVGVNLFKVVYCVASHFFVSLVDGYILAPKYGKVEQKKWRYNGDRAFMSMMQEGAVNRPE